ncbi:Uncharacterized protein FKW44_001196, partial [Caligus rogercresseyi]
QAKLLCYYDHRHEPALRLSPLKVDVNHREPHLLGIISSVKSKLQVAGVGNDKKISDMRVSSHAWIPDASLRSIIGLRSVARLDPEAKKEEYEMLQVANYGLGGHYDCHHDSMFIYKEPDFLPESLEETKAPYITGDR